MFVLSGIIFLLIAVLGKVEGKIDPGNVGRLGALLLCVALMIVGVAMQYIEIHEAAQKRAAQLSHTQSPVAASAVTPAAQQSDAVATSDKPTIKVVSGTYGHSCNAKTGNATAPLAKACVNTLPATLRLRRSPCMEELVPSCSRDFSAEWKCGSGSTVYSATLPASASKGEKLHLACAG
jgi:hypothetical protein